MKVLSNTLIALSFICATTGMAQTIDQAPWMSSKKSVAEERKTVALIYHHQKEGFDSWDSAQQKWINVGNIRLAYNPDGKESERIMLDTAMTEYARELSFYNAQNLLSEYLYQKKTNAGWVNTSHVLRSYTPSGIVTEDFYQTWDTTTHSWINYRRLITAHDSHDNLIERRSDDFENGNWVIKYGRKTLLEYDQDNITKETGLAYNTTDNTWDTTYRVYNNYTNNLLAEAITQAYDGVNWFNAQKQSYTYDSVGVITQVKTDVYNQMTNEWRNYDLYKDITWIDWIGDPKPIIEGYTYMLWDTTTTSYVNNRKYKVTIPDNNGGYILTNESYNNNAWVPSDRQTILMDDHKNRTLFRKEDNLNNQWNIYFERSSEFTYDSLSRLTEQVDWDWNFLLNAPYKSLRTRYSDFKEFNTGTGKDKLINTLSLYPNPAREKASIQFSVSNEALVNIDVYNITGQKISTIVSDENISSGEHTYTIHHLTQGIYLVRLSVNGHTETRKLVVY